tara:strand:- start:4129 stop:4953 length:825 start_codon:yes stop_codon:yes gene_type:complete
MNNINLKKVINDILKNSDNLTVAVSGGIDSITLAAFLSTYTTKEHINIAHAVSPAVPKEASNRVRKLAKRFNWNLNIINANELNDSRYQTNPYNRCFFCKENLYNSIKYIFNGTILSGANKDDLNDFRPGLIAAKNANVRHPFIEANFSKINIRKLASEIGLGTMAYIPSSPCLASRIETGIPITKKLLNNIEMIENNIKKIIPNSDVRCRWMNNNVNIQFKYPNVKDLSNNQKIKILKNIHNIFSISKDKIILSEYKKGSAFIPKTSGNVNAN